jgi:hypothetical protein
MGLERMACVLTLPNLLYNSSSLLFRIPDLPLTLQHPKRAFMRRAIEFEIRLSYHDRILKTLPPVMQEEDANVIAVQTPGPDFEYEEPCTSCPMTL